MSQTGRIEIPLSKKKLFLALFGSIAFVGIGLRLLLRPPVSNHPIFGNPTLALVAGLAGVLFFGFVAVVVAGKLRDNTPGLVISDEGIVDNASGVAAGFVPWADVREITRTSLMGQQFLVVIVKNPQTYLDRQPSAIKRRSMQMSHNSYGSPIGISANALATDFDTLTKLLESRFAQYRYQ